MSTALCIVAIVTAIVVGAVFVFGVIMLRTLRELWDLVDDDKRMNQEQVR